MEVLDGAHDAAGNDHRARLPADFLLGDDLVVEVVHHDFCLLTNGVRVSLNIGFELALRFFVVEFGVVFYGLDEVVITMIRRVVSQHVEDETFLDGLLHCVAVERTVLDGPVRLWVGFTEDFEGLVFGRRGERKVARVGKHLPGYHETIDDVFCVFVIFFGTGLGEGDVHFGGGAAALAGVRLVDENGKLAVSVFVADVGQHERELLNGRDDDFLSVLEEFFKFSRSLGVADDAPDLGELFDGVPNLFVQKNAVRDDDDRVVDWGRALFEADELVGKPRDRVGLAATRRMLNQITVARAVDSRVG